MKLYKAQGVHGILWVCATVGFFWGLVESSVALSLGSNDPFTIFLFYPLVTLVLGGVLSVMLAPLSADRALPLIAWGVVALACAVPLSVGINLWFVKNVPFLSITNAAIVLGSLVVGLVPGAIAGWAARWISRFLLDPRPGGSGVLLWLLPITYFCLCGTWTAAVFIPREPGPWLDNRGHLADQPNVVLIVLDTLRADHLSCYGYPLKTTPNLDALPAACFTKAYAQGHWTPPSTASLLTGLYPATHKTNLYNSVLPGQTVTLTEMLKAQGYVTGFFTGNLAVTSTFGFTRGGDYVISELRLPQYRLYPSSLGCVLRRKMGNLARADELNKWIFPFLASVKDRRFFLYLHYKDPHQPYTPPAPYNQIYNPGYKGRHIIDPTREDQWPITEPERMNMIALYDGEIRFLDEQIGQVFQAIRRLHLEENTLLIVTSDHGEEFADHGGWLHGKTVYEEVIRVPLLIAYPPLRTEGRIVDQPVRLVDVVPTVLDILGLPQDPALQGRSLLPLLVGREGGGTRDVLSEGTSSGHTAYVRGPFKLIRHQVDGKITYSLYQLESDPKEKENIAPKHPDLVNDLREEMERAEKRFKKVVIQAEQKELDSLEEQHLRELGYIR